MSKQITIVSKHTGLLPQVITIENSYSVISSMVEGYIEVVNVDNDIIMICNEEGKLKNLPVNFETAYDTIVGNVIFCTVQGEDFDSLNPEQIEKVLNLFNN